MKLDSYFFCAVELKKAERLIAVVRDFRVGSVVANEDVVLLAELYESFVKVRVGYCRRRVVGIIHEEYLRLLLYVLGYGVEVGKESILFK